MFKSSYGRNSNAKRYAAKEQEVDETSDDLDEDEDENAIDEEGNIWVPAPDDLLKKKTACDEEEEFEEEDDSDERDDDESEEVEAEETETEPELLTLGQTDKTQLPEGKAVATVTGVAATREASKYGSGTYVRVEITLNVKNSESGEVFAKKFFAAKDSDRLFDLVSGILGFEPEEGFNLKSLVNKKAVVVIEHRENPKGELWDEIVSAKPYVKPSAKKNYR